MHGSEQTLFINDYQSCFSKDNNNNNGNKTTGDLLFEQLKFIVEQDKYKEVLVSFIPNLFDHYYKLLEFNMSFLDNQYSLKIQLLFNFISELWHLIQINLKNNEFGIQITGQLLTLINNYRIYKLELDSSNNSYVCLQNISNYISTIISDEMNDNTITLNFISSISNCFIQLSKLNTALIDNYLLPFLNYLWLHFPIELQITVICQLLSIFTNVRQFPKLIESILTTFKNNSNSKLNALNNDIFVIKFIDCVNQLPIGQLPFVWKLIESFTIIYNEKDDESNDNKITITNLFVILMKRIPILKSNANEVVNLLLNIFQISISTKINKLIANNNNKNINDVNTQYIHLLDNMLELLLECLHYLPTIVYQDIELRTNNCINNLFVIAIQLSDWFVSNNSIKINNNNNNNNNWSNEYSIMNIICKLIYNKDVINKFEEHCKDKIGWLNYIMYPLSHSSTCLFTCNCNGFKYSDSINSNYNNNNNNNNILLTVDTSIVSINYNLFNLLYWRLISNHLQLFNFHFMLTQNSKPSSYFLDNLISPCVCFYQQSQYHNDLSMHLIPFNNLTIGKLNYNCLNNVIFYEIAILRDPMLHIICTKIVNIIISDILDTNKLLSNFHNQLLDTFNKLNNGNDIINIDQLIGFFNNYFSSQKLTIKSKNNNNGNNNNNNNALQLKTLFSILNNLPINYYNINQTIGITMTLITTDLLILNNKENLSEDDRSEITKYQRQLLSKLIQQQFKQHRKLITELYIRTIINNIQFMSNSDVIYYTYKFMEDYMQQLIVYHDFNQIFNNLIANINNNDVFSLKIKILAMIIECIIPCIQTAISKHKIITIKHFNLNNLLHLEDICTNQLWDLFNKNNIVSLDNETIRLINNYISYMTSLLQFKRNLAINRVKGTEKYI